MSERRVSILSDYRPIKKEYLVVEPSRDSRGNWRVKFCAQGDPERLVTITGAMKLVVELRCIGEDDLAKRVEKVAAATRRYASKRQ